MEKHCLFLCALALIPFAHQQDTLTATFHVIEETPKGTPVVQLSTIDHLSDIQAELKPYLRFNFLTQNNIQATSLFHLNELTGDMTTAEVIDRDVLCVVTTICSLQFDVGVGSTHPQSTLFRILTIKIIIDDINDNEPTFPKKNLTLSIAESYSVDSVFLIDMAVDADTSPKFALKKYEIIPSNGSFALEVVTNPDTGLVIRLGLKLNEKLDREKINFYKLFVIAKDGDDPPKVGILPINITVSDTNDNAPVFTNSSYSATLRENMAVGSVVLQLIATDPDSGDNAKIKYRFSALVAENLRKLFAVNETSGELSVLSPLSYHSIESYKLIVEAVDQGSPSLVSQTTVFIRILDTKNSPPMVYVNLLSSGSNGVANIPENSDVGYFVAHVSVIDSDTGSNGIVNCGIIDDTFALAPVLGKGYKVVVNGQLDREKRTTYNVTVVCKDEGSPILGSSDSFLVQVIDVNDNPPKFVQNHYSGMIMENNDKVEEILQVSAVDMDIGINGDIFYKVQEGEDSHKFTVERDGIIKTNSKFDREFKSKYVFHILAIDEGEKPLTATATVSVLILDTNDTPPTIITPVLYVEENLPAYTVVGFVQASDNDTDHHARVKFRFLNSMPSSFPFTLLPDGQLKSKVKLDRELDDRYTFRVVAWDNDGSFPSLSSTSAITIHIIDKNDNAPLLIFPSKFNNTVNVPLKSKVKEIDMRNGRFITKIQVYDRDAGENAEVQYFIIEGNNDSLFYMDNNNGELFLMINESRSLWDATYTLKLLIQDKGTPMMETEGTLHVRLNRTNNSQLAVSKKENDQSYIVIIIIIAIVTLAVAISIIALIIFLKRWDKQRKLRGATTNNVVIASNNLPGGGIVLAPYDNNTMENNIQNSSYDTPKKVTKKEVSFSFNEEFQNRNNSQQENKDQLYLEEKRNISGINSNEINRGAEDGKPVYASMQLLQDKYLRESKPVNHQLRLPGHDDIHSETSGEVSTSDSGKGGSIEDVNSNEEFRLWEAKHMKPQPNVNRINNSQYNNSVNNASPPLYSSLTGLNCISPVPNNYRDSSFSSFTPGRKNSNMNHSSSKYSRVTFSEPVEQKNVNNVNSSPKSLDWNSNCLESRSAYIQYLSGRIPGGSTADDDDASTTTSGSYTVNHEEIDSMIPSKDCIV